MRIFTPPDVAVGAHFYGQHGIKTILLFLPADGEASRLLLQGQVWSPYYTVQSENKYSCILKVTSWV